MQPTTVRRGVPASQYHRLAPVQAVAVALNMAPASAAQVLKGSDSRSPFPRAARIVSALIAAGHPVRAEQLCQPIDLARVVVIEPVTRESFDAALEDEQRADGAEDVPEMFIRDRASYETWRKRAAEQVSKTLRAMRVGDAHFFGTAA